MDEAPERRPPKTALLLTALKATVFFLYCLPDAICFFTSGDWLIGSRLVRLAPIPWATSSCAELRECFFAACIVPEGYWSTTPCIWVAAVVFFR